MEHITDSARRSDRRADSRPANASLNLSGRKTLHRVSGCHKLPTVTIETNPLSASSTEH
ncbi:hypothetical protein DPMN_027475 [Dreissena polymorpha]|uniref:Uncharacterized protein n=1 Tax=Dreissena polymorpha TaxID=45954 RepID=A0A9D4LSY0_DREPO|nr:hypothetical protein DPMN_027475 [Dreissena polymorpha]